MRIDTAACLGKIPTYGDFVRVRASTPTMRKFDEWIRKGLHHARQHWEDGWKTAYTTASSRRFLFWGEGPQAPNVLVGVLRLSRDEKGRTYPFVITLEVPKHSLRSRHSVYLPVQAASFFAAAEACVREATEGGLSTEEVMNRVKQLSGVEVLPAVPRDYKRYLQEETAGTLLGDVFGHFEDSEKYLFFSHLFEVLGSLQANPSSALEGGLQFPLPLPESPPEHVVSFWSEFVLRVLGEEAESPTLFWTESQERASTTHTHLYLGVPAPRMFIDALWPSGGKHILRLGHGNNRNPAEAALSIPEEYGALLERKQIRLWDFLRQL